MRLHERSFGLYGSVIAMILKDAMTPWTFIRSTRIGQKPAVLRETMKFYFGLSQILIYGDATFESLFLFLIHAWRLAPFIAPFDVPEAMKSLKRIGGQEEVTYKTWDFYRPMAGKALIAHDPTGLYKRGETPPQFFTFYLEPSREIKMPFVLQVNFLQIPSSLCHLLHL